MHRYFLIISAVAGFTGVAFGAFGAHALKSRLSHAADGNLRLGWWETGAHYHLIHALALGLVAAWLSRQHSRLLMASGFSFTLGVVLFCGSLYLMALTNTRALGAVTPLGGLGFLVGWALLGVAAYRAGSTLL